jgi:hypothetical protein
MGREMIDWTKPIETADGRAAKLLSRGYWRNGETYCVVQIEDDGGNSEIVIVNPTTGYGAWSSKGQFRNARVKRKAWVSLRCIEFGQMADTKDGIESQISQRDRDNGWEACYVEWEE